MNKPILFKQSALYRLRSTRKLAELLRVDMDQLEYSANSGLAGYAKPFPVNGRYIETPLAPLKRIQRRIHDLLSRVPPPDYVFSGYKGRSAISNAAYHLENARTWIAKLDVRQFYPSSQGRLVYELFLNDFECSSDVATILMKLCTIRGTIVAQRPHLPTGGVTSPILAYLCYWRLFEELNALALTCGAKFSIMADDITFSGLPEGHRILNLAQEAINKHGLRVNHKKLRNWSPSHHNKLVTGVNITPKGLRVPKRRKDRVRDLNLQLKRTQSVVSLNKTYEQLHGMLSFCGQIEGRFSVGSRYVLQEWKLNPAWEVHRNNSRR
jgi:RNA-directed DNA polymerase